MLWTRNSSIIMGGGQTYFVLEPKLNDLGRLLRYSEHGIDEGTVWIELEEHEVEDKVCRGDQIPEFRTVREH